MQALVQPYQSAWKLEFDRLKNVLERALEGFAVDIQHVGSTAVPGLVAKPILDVDIIIHDKPLLEPIDQTLQQLGYRSRGEQGIPGRFAFRQSGVTTPHTADGRAWMEHHLYVCFADSLALKNHILFRDALLQDPKLTEAYAQLKLNLVSQPGMTRERYTTLKTEFILSVLNTAGLGQHELAAIQEANR
ncbi:GrpB family protein [Rudanella paleaurantiibacter]|uniref:GrpB family protein n=1 Tax=Rudanella paleaurantiibacter TaxID=2614655 RepID=A0A7J5TWN1_9BACT|nr:GrpB family protein [Rudanella paleaurantiibacter]KAB7729038.1 GrpB family protein [Rudanella paleaurantiibacter]